MPPPGAPPQGVHLFLAPFALCAALLCLLIGLLIAFKPIGKWTKAWTIAVGSISTFVSVSSLILFTCDLSGINLTPEFAARNQFPPLASLAFMLLNMALAVTAILRCRTYEWRLNWLPYPAALSFLLGTFVLYSAQVAQEITHLQVEDQRSANQIRSYIEARINADANAISHMASRMSMGIESEHQYWSQDARAYLQDYPEFKAVEWLDEDGFIRWVEPLTGNEQVLNQNLSMTGRRLLAAQRAKRSGSVSVSQSVNLRQGGKGILIYAPTYRNGKYNGLIAGVCLVDRFSRAIPSELGDKYTYQIVEGDSVIYKKEPLKEGFPVSGESDVERWKLDWKVYVQPLNLTNAWTSQFGLLILLVGFAVTGLTFLCLVLLERVSNLAKRQLEERRFLEGLSDSSASATYVFDLNRRRMVYSNRFGHESLGLTEEQILDGGLPLLKKMVHPDDWAKTLQQFSDVRKLLDGEIYEFEHRICNGDGNWRWIAYRECVLERSFDGTVKKVLLTSQDVTGLREAADQLRQANDDLEQLFENAPIGMAQVGLDGKWMYVNPALCQIVGYPKEELLQIDFQAITHPDDLDRDLDHVYAMLAGEISTYTMEKRYYRKDGQLIWILLCVSLIRNTDGSPSRFVSQIQDITERKLSDLLNQEYTQSLVQHTDFLAEANQRLEMESRTDALTGIANRRLFVERLSHSIQHAHKAGRQLTAIMLDVDHFKKFNDDFGHKAGDIVLQKVADVLAMTCRESDLPARWGGEEFIVLCADTDLWCAIKLAERLRKEIEEIELPYRSVTASFGVASVGYDPATFIDRADSALYAAKEAGRNCVRVDDAGQESMRNSA